MHIKYTIVGFSGLLGIVALFAFPLSASASYGWIQFDTHSSQGFGECVSNPSDPTNPDDPSYVECNAGNVGAEVTSVSGTICGDSQLIGSRSENYYRCSLISGPVTLTTAISSGSGSITGVGINCPGDCSENYAFNTWQTIIATPSAGYSFSGWSGSCAGQTESCSILMDGDKNTSANFMPPFNYGLSNSGDSNVTKSSSDVFTTNTITKNLTAGLTKGVTLTPSGMPVGVSASVANQGCAPTCTSVITFTVSPNTVAGTYPITVTGAPLNKKTKFNLVVSGNAMSVSCSANPSTTLLGQNVTWTASVSGGTPPFTYSWSGTNIPTSPAPSVNPYVKSYSTIGQKTATASVTGGDFIQATCPPATAQINFDPKFKEF